MEDDWQDILFGKPAPALPMPAPTPMVSLPAVLGDDEVQRRRGYARKALEAEAAEVATAPEGARNHTLNRAAFNLRRFVTENVLTVDEVRDTLGAAARANGLDTLEIGKTLGSAERGADAKPRDRPAIPEARHPYEISAPRRNGTNGAGAPAGVGGAIVTTNRNHPTNLDTADDEEQHSVFGSHPPIDAGQFLFDTEDTSVALWGADDDILWAEGEALMIAGGMGLGKTTLAGQIIRAQLGLNPTEVLGLPVTEVDGPILYLAMDRPRQIRRSMLRQFAPSEREHISNRLLIRVGPPLYDIALYPSLLAQMAAEAGAAVVYVDSLKDAAIGLSDDKVGAAYNRGRQQLLADGCQICELHHNRKAIAGANTGPGGVSDIYGSTWLTSGAGSVVMLTGEPGDPIIEFRHVKQPMNEVGPWRLLNNPEAGRMDIEHQVDLIELVQANRIHGLTAQAAAGILFDTDKPTRAQSAKAKYKLNKLVDQGLLMRIDGIKGGANGGTSASWYPAITP